MDGGGVFTSSSERGFDFFSGEILRLQKGHSLGHGRCRD